PDQLVFGMADCGCGDNFGGYSVTIDPVDPDEDHDGVVDATEPCSCLGTTPSTPVSAKVCSGDQLCPCAASQGRTGWTDHAEYVRCVRGAGHELLDLGAISRADRLTLVRTAAGSSCGH